MAFLLQVSRVKTVEKGGGKNLLFIDTFKWFMKTKVLSIKLVCSYSSFSHSNLKRRVECVHDNLKKN